MTSNEILKRLKKAKRLFKYEYFHNKGYTRISEEKAIYVLNQYAEQTEKELYISTIMSWREYCVKGSNEAPPMIYEVQTMTYYLNPDYEYLLEGFEKKHEWDVLFELDYKSWAKTIADYYGYDAQSDILLEEMSELQKEILKKRRGADNRKEIVNEIADVQIMLNQMIHLLHITDDEMTIATRNKLSRQLSRIRKDKKQKAIERKNAKEQKNERGNETDIN